MNRYCHGSNTYDKFAVANIYDSEIHKKCDINFVNIFVGYNFEWTLVKM